MKVKVCGMRDSNNIQEVVELSPDYLGFIFYEKSKRFVPNFPQVYIPNSIKKVGVFVNESVEEILEIVTNYKLDVVQLHGDETPEFCEEIRRHPRLVSGSHNELDKNVISTTLKHQIEIIKAFSIDENFNFEKTKKYESSCDMFIFDTKGKGYGGTGLKYDWNILKNYRGDTPFLLSGGIGVDDVEAILSFLQRQESKKCIGVDLNSGFEDAPAMKNIEKLKTFIDKLNIN